LSPRQFCQKIAIFLERLQKPLFERIAVPKTAQLPSTHPASLRERREADMPVLLRMPGINPETLSMILIEPLA